MDCERIDYKLELSIGANGNFVFSWNLVHGDFDRRAKAYFYNRQGKFLGMQWLTKDRGTANTSISVNSGVYATCAGLNQYTTSFYPDIIYDMTNVIYYSSSNVDVKSLKMGILDGHFRVHVETDMHRKNDFVGLYDSFNAQDCDFVECHMMLNQAMHNFAFQKPVKPGYHLRYVTSDETGKLRRVRVTDELADVRIHDHIKMRRPSNAEWIQLLETFPKLCRDNTWITDSFTPEYNCIAWSLGFDDRWISPATSKQQMSIFYEMHGCSQTTIDAQSKICAWELDGIPTHGSRIYSENDKLWESKLGSSWRITHGRNELQGENYGNIFASFTAPSINMACEKRKRKEWSCRELRVIQAEIDQIPAEIQNEFDEKFDFWKKQWSEIPFVFSSNTNDFKDAPGWNALLGMGEEMLPLLLQKLCDEENFPALVLYEAIQNNKDLIVDPMEDWLAGEQTRAIRVVEKWIAMAEDKKASESS